MTDFYEEDEPVADIAAAFERGVKRRTGQAEEVWGFEINVAVDRAELRISDNRFIERTGLDVSS